MLVIDDDRLSARSIRRALGACTLVSSVAEGVQAAIEEQPDVIVLDAYLDGDPSFDAIAKLRAAAPRTQIVMVTGFASDEDRERARRLGARAYIDKSDIGQLRRVVKAVSALSTSVA